MRERLTLYLIFFLLGIVAILFLLHDAGFLHFMGELHDFFWQLVSGLVKIALMLIVLASLFAIAYGIVILHREMGVVRPNKYGKAQAIRRFRQDPYELSQDGDGRHRDMELSKLMYQVMQEREKAMALQYKALESQRRYEEKALPPPSMELPPVVEVKGPATEQINLSPQYTMHVDEALSHRGLLTGTSGSGKSFTTALIIEEFLRPELEVPFVVFDTEGEYRRLPHHMGRGVTYGPDDVCAAEAEAFGRHLISAHSQVVLDVSAYADVEEAARVMCGTLTGISRWEEQRANELRVAVMVFLTEAHKWFPQYATENQLTAQVYQLMQIAFLQSLVRRGRKRGMGLIFDTQKLSEVDKRLIQADWKVCLRQTEDRCLERYEKWGIQREEATTLKNGEGFIYSTRVTKLRARMNKRQSPDDSKSRGIESIRNHRPEESELWMPNYRMSSIYTNEPVESVHMSSAGSLPNDFEAETREKALPEIPERFRTQVETLYSTGMGRKEIQAKLSINGDEYWMLKQVCDEYDRQKGR